MAKATQTVTAPSAFEAFVESIRSESFVVTVGKREGNPVSIPVPVADMPANALFAMFAYGVQRKFNDAVGGSDMTTDKKAAAVREMIEAYKRGEVAKSRGTGEAVDPVVAEIRSILRPDVKAGWIKANDAAGWKSLEEDEIEAMLDDAFAAQDAETQAAIREVAVSNIAAKEAMRKAKSGLSGKLSLKV